MCACVYVCVCVCVCVCMCVCVCVCVSHIRVHAPMIVYFSGKEKAELMAAVKKRKWEQNPSAITNAVDTNSTPSHALKELICLLLLFFSRIYNMQGFCLLVVCVCVCVCSFVSSVYVFTCECEWVYIYMPWCFLKWMWFAVVVRFINIFWKSDTFSQAYSCLIILSAVSQWISFSSWCVCLFVCIMYANGYMWGFVSAHVCMCVCMCVCVCGVWSIARTLCNVF